MPLRRFGLATVALLVAFVLGAGWASASEHEAGTLTTQLQPGWNMAGWLGPDAPVSELFEAVPALERVYAWDSAHERYQRALPNTTPLHGLRRLKTGMGLWLRVGGDSAVEWTRPVSEDHVLLSLPAGRHLVGWTGRDGEAFADSAGRFGDALIEASRWNAETQQYDRYRSDAEDSANTLLELNRGDAMWLDLADDRRWWQSGLAGTTFEFRGELSEEQQASLQEDIAGVVTFFAERYAIEPPEFSVLYDPNLEVFAGAYPRQILVSTGALEYSLREVTLAHEYFHILQRHFGGGLRSPAWMTEGAATYAGGLLERAGWSKSGEDASPGAMVGLPGGHRGARRSRTDPAVLPRRSAGLQPGRHGGRVAGGARGDRRRRGHRGHHGARRGRVARQLHGRRDVHPLLPAAPVRRRLGGGVRGSLRHRAG